MKNESAFWAYVSWNMGFGGPMKAFEVDVWKTEERGKFWVKRNVSTELELCKNSSSSSPF